MFVEIVRRLVFDLYGLDVFYLHLLDEFQKHGRVFQRLNGGRGPIRIGLTGLDYWRAGAMRRRTVRAIIHEILSKRSVSISNFELSAHVRNILHGDGQILDA